MSLLFSFTGTPLKACTQYLAWACYLNVGLNHVARNDQNGNLIKATQSLQSVIHFCNDSRGRASIKSDSSDVFDMGLDTVS